MWEKTAHLLGTSSYVVASKLCGILYTNMELVPANYYIL